MYCVRDNGDCREAKDRICPPKGHSQKGRGCLLDTIIHKES